jgi:hypothetical protein
MALPKTLKTFRMTRYLQADPGSGTPRNSGRGTQKPENKNSPDGRIVSPLIASDFGLAL